MQEKVASALLWAMSSRTHVAASSLAFVTVVTAGTMGLYAMAHAGEADDAASPITQQVREADERQADDAGEREQRKASLESWIAEARAQAGVSEAVGVPAVGGPAKEYSVKVPEKESAPNDSSEGGSPSTEEASAGCPGGVTFELSADALDLGGTNAAGPSTGTAADAAIPNSDKQGFLKQAGKAYLYDDEGRKCSGFWSVHSDDGESHVYYFDPKDGGAAATGLASVPYSDGESRLALFDDAGRMQFGEQKCEDGQWRCFDPVDGHALTGWVKTDNGQWRYYSSDDAKLAMPEGDFDANKDSDWEELHAMWDKAWRMETRTDWQFICDPCARADGTGRVAIFQRDKEGNWEPTHVWTCVGGDVNRGKCAEGQLWLTTRCAADQWDWYDVWYVNLRPWTFSGPDAEGQALHGWTQHGNDWPRSMYGSGSDGCVMVSNSRAKWVWANVPSGTGFYTIPGWNTMSYGNDTIGGFTYGKHVKAGGSPGTKPDWASRPSGDVSANGASAYLGQQTSFEWPLG